MNLPIIGFLVAVAVVVAIYFLFVVPGERKYHETKLRLMQERIARREQAKQNERRESDARADSGG
ncbi:MAG: hypothetical protein R3315_13905 [Woeseiaceae bacterium]|nr:hypothetical protein [Woeseiaceae bacterium]